MHRFSSQTRELARLRERTSVRFTNRQVQENTDRRITERRIHLRLGSMDTHRVGAKAVDETVRVGPTLIGLT